MDQQNQNVQTASAPVPPVRKWGGKETLTLIFLIFLPVVGLILTWTITNWSKKAKIIVTIIFLLLPAVAIIGILSTITLVSLGGARDNAKDARITADINMINLAQEFYYAQNYRYFTSTYLPEKIDSFAMPETAEGYGYEWVNNLSDDQKFCVYAQLSDETFIITTQIGTGKRSTEPRTLSECLEFDR